MKILLFALLAVISISLPSAYGCNCPYQGYFAQTSKAEVFIAQKNYSRALHIYEEVLSEMPGFARDYLHATLVSGYLHDTVSVLKWAKNALKSGINLKMLEKKKALVPYIGLSSWEELRSNSDSLNMLAYPRPAYWKELKQMHKRDQKIRNFPYIIFGKMVSKKMLFRVDEENYTRLKEIIEEIGYPGELLIGPSHVAPKDLYAFFILRHNIEGENDQEFIKQLHSFMCKGELHATDYAKLIDRHNRLNNQPEVYGMFFSSIGYPSYLQTGQPHPSFPYVTPQVLEDMNQARQEIGLANIQDAVSTFSLIPEFFIP